MRFFHKLTQWATKEWAKHTKNIMGSKKYGGKRKVRKKIKRKLDKIAKSYSIDNS